VDVFGTSDGADMFINHSKGFGSYGSSLKMLYVANLQTLLQNCQQQGETSCISLLYLPA
jgi:hypothetical protein